MLTNYILHKRVFFGKLPSVEKLPSFYGTRNFMTVFTKPHNDAVRTATWIQSKTRNLFIQSWTFERNEGVWKSGDKVPDIHKIDTIIVPCQHHISADLYGGRKFFRYVLRKKLGGLQFLSSILEQWWILFLLGPQPRHIRRLALSLSTMPTE